MLVTFAPAFIFLHSYHYQDDRNDKSQCVLDIIYKMDVERFKNEISLLEVQIDDWKKEIRTIDVEILNKISSIDTKVGNSSDPTREYSGKYYDVRILILLGSKSGQNKQKEGRRD